MPVVLNMHHPGVKDRVNHADALYVGRPTKWGNPFEIGLDEDRASVVIKYEEWLMKNEELLSEVGELRGENLACWCAPLVCHADVLIRLANGD